MKTNRFLIWLALGLVVFRTGTAEPWKFGLIGDTQWPSSREYDSLGGFRNPNGVAVDILRQIDREFIARGVDLVIAVGDLSDYSTNTAYHTRATWAQPLYDAGIGFFPLRGNHDNAEEPPNAAEFLRVFPQTRNGIMNRTPEDAFDWTDSAFLHPTFTSTTRSPFARGTGFSSPRPSLSGLSYSFSHNNATFVLLDQFRTTDPTETNTIVSQIPWIDSVLHSRPSGTHAFVLGHKGILTESHADNLFGADPSVDSSGTNRFLRSLAGNGVQWYIGGHDHLHNRALVSATNDSTMRIQEIILAGASYKSYHPPSEAGIDSFYNLPAFGRTRQIQLSQDLFRLGFTIVTVDGPRITAEYWASPVLENISSLDSVPDQAGRWTLRETFGYSLNGRQFLVPQGGSYTVVRDSGLGTRLRILGGTNADRSTDYSARAFRQELSTSWKEAPGMASAAATLRGMRLAQGSERTAPFTLSLSYDKARANWSDLLTGRCVVLRAQGGVWRSAVVSNTGGTPLFVRRPWSATDPLGTYGVDTASGTAWAVIHHEGEFAVGLDPTRPAPPEKDVPRVSHRKLVFPALWEGLEMAVHVRGLDGRIAVSHRTSKRSLDLDEVGHGLFALQVSISSREMWNGFVYLP